jgi:outer membrane protein assembly factor BamB
MLHHFNRTLALPFLLILLIMGACSNGSDTTTGMGTVPTATASTTATTTPTEVATATPGAASPTPTFTPAATSTPSPTQTPSPPKTVIFAFTGVDVLTAFNADTRAQIWHRDLGGSPNQPVYANGLLYVYGEPYKLEAYNPHTGAHVWVAPYYSELTPIVTGNLIYNMGFVSGSGSTFTYMLTALNAQTGSVVWHQTMNTDGASYVLANGIMYVPGLQSNTTTTIYSYNAATGTPMTTYTINTPFENLLDDVANGIAYYHCGNGNICAANLVTQTSIWHFHTNGIDVGPFTVANGIGYFGPEDNHLYAVNAATGALMWSYATGGSVQSQPIIMNGNCYFSSTDRHYYGLNGSGHLLWRAPIGGGNHDSGQWYNGQIYFPDDTVEAGVVEVINPATGAITQLISIPAGSFVVASW